MLLLINVESFTQPLSQSHIIVSMAIHECVSYKSTATYTLFAEQKCLIEARPRLSTLPPSAANVDTLRSFRNTQTPTTTSASLIPLPPLPIESIFVVVYFNLDSLHLVTAVSFISNLLSLFFSQLSSQVHFYPHIFFARPNTSPFYI